MLITHNIFSFATTVSLAEIYSCVLLLIKVFNFKFRLFEKQVYCNSECISDGVWRCVLYLRWIFGNTQNAAATGLYDQTDPTRKSKYMYE